MGKLAGVIKQLEAAKRLNSPVDLQSRAEDLLTQIHSQYTESDQQALRDLTTTLERLEGAQVEGAIRLQTALMDVARSIGEQPTGELASLQESLAEFTQKIAAEFTTKLNDLIERLNQPEKWEFEIERDNYTDLIRNVTAIKQARSS